MGFFTRLLMVAAVSLTFTACQSNPQQPTAEADAEADKAPHIRAEALLAQANVAEPNQKLQLMLEAAELLAEEGDSAWARSIINNLPGNANPPEDQLDTLYARRALVNSLISAADGYYPLAYENINDTQLMNTIKVLPLPLAQKIRRNRASYLFDMEYYSASIDERIALSDLLSEESQEEKAENFDAIWQTLMEIPLPQLTRLAEASQSRIQQGWYELARLSKDNQTNLREQVEQVDRWVLDWPEHPASFELPADLQLLKQLYQEQPQQIALLMPESGALGVAANAIRDGFMAAYYQMQNSEDSVPSLRFYDTSQGDINEIYDRAVNEGAQLVIGPLKKEHITDLALRGEMAIPTLALNNVESPMGTVSNLYQFGLGVEDEAALAANKAWHDGHRRALILAPNTVWGDRSVEAFSQVWLELGGELNRDYRFEDTNDYSKVIKHALQLDASQARAREVLNIVGHIEFEPRRRQDIDVIFLAAQANQARQVKPTLAFHYADDIPVYGTSHVYSGHPESKLDQDMNGVRFSTLPWFFNKDLPEKQDLQSAADTSPNLQPLYALGVDSYHLYPRLQQLQQIKQARFYGQTGKLRIDEQNQIHRQQIWAEFKKGRARPLAEAD